MDESIRAYVGLGANVGDARRTLAAAVRSLASLPGARLAGVSSLYRTKPVGVVDQPDFLNAVAALDLPVPGEAIADVTQAALGLLVALKRLEHEAGRRRRRRWGPRELDLDLLLYGQHRIVAERPPEAKPASAALDPTASARLLEVPHPSMRDRLFVLAPLAELDQALTPPGWDEPVGSIADRLRALDPTAVEPLARWSSDRMAWG